MLPAADAALRLTKKNVILKKDVISSKARTPCYVGISRPVHEAITPHRLHVNERDVNAPHGIRGGDSREIGGGRRKVSNCWCRCPRLRGFRGSPGGRAGRGPGRGAAAPGPRR